MIALKNDFNDRVAEIDTYFSLIDAFILKDARLFFPDNNRQEKASDDLLKVLKANSFLLLYNLIEFCIKSAIEEIHISMDRNNIGFDEIKEGIRNNIFKELKNSLKEDDFTNNIQNISSYIILACFDKRKLFSGNVAAKEIKKIAGVYGFSTNTDKSKTRDGIELLTVKNKRNDLAHGHYSFKECGKDYTIQDVKKIKNETIDYLTQILDNVEIYINNKEYLK
jgi:hypothetical protein